MQAILHHIPVMVEEVLLYLKVKPDCVYVDGTIGQGGHSRKILSKLSSEGKLVGIDRDEEVLEHCHQEFFTSYSQLSLYHNSYHNLFKVLQSEGLNTVDGIVLDLGLSSVQLGSENRGFSFSKNSMLDMRFDRSNGKPAAQLLQKLSLKELENILKNFGEERYYKKIAYKIKQTPDLITTTDLKKIVQASTPPANRNKSFARVFQAIRIAVNKELEILDKFLNNFIECLSPNGKIVVISYHSLEDRIVKQSFKKLKQDRLLNILTKKPLQPNQDELKKNSRSRSAKLRAAERI
ncbi:MAG: hypothetical protein CMG69_06110 [Candidatus Marinimicrobia bacterium]|nr:hypothetical protein [Candidatus Neomarinimicrobiota bacterium]|tara:strand:- start:22673 stop:23551 length:879 start_codon:yes stop_codon:yes gene_type:complete